MRWAGDPSKVSDRFPSLASLVVQYCVIFVLEAETPSNIPGSFPGCGAGVELDRSRIPSWPYHRVPSLSVQFEQLMAWNPSVEKHGAGSQSCQRRVFFPWVGPNTTQGPVKIWREYITTYFGVWQRAGSKYPVETGRICIGSLQF